MADLLAAHGIPVLMGGAIGDLLRYAYHDASDQLQLIVETTSVNPAGDLGVLAAGSSEYPPAGS